MLIGEGVDIKDDGTDHLTCLITFHYHCFLFFLFLLTITLSVLLRFKASEYPFGIFLWPLYCLYFFDFRPQITPLVSSNFSCITRSIPSLYSGPYMSWWHWLVESTGRTIPVRFENSKSPISEKPLFWNEQCPQ